ncbi:MAG: hypothetical protein M1838_003118 [Thelocarpon superellum]|nr:MAG: hypothetical protein M1838_003118 [Thelocarpon superellum]
MGCCLSSSRHRDADPAGPYTSSTGHGPSGDLSTRAIADDPSNVSRGSDAEARTPSTTTQVRRRRSETLNEQFNKPLKRHVWSSTKQWTREMLDREREEYFDTRVTGRPETWHALRMAIETMDDDLSTAQTIIDAAGITIPTGDLINGVYDEIGNYYQIPEPCISDPLNLVAASEADEATKDEIGTEIEDETEAQRRREEKGKAVIPATEMHAVTARLSDRGGPDVHVGLGREQPITGRNKIRIAYMGRILKDGETLASQGWHEGHVVNALVFP